MSAGPPRNEPARRRARRRAPLAVRLLRAVALGVAIYVVALALGQRAVLFPGTALHAPEGLHASVDGLERLWVDVDGGRVEAWLLPAPIDVPRPAPAVLMAHGNYELIDFQLPFARALRELGVAVLLVEYPGYGRSGGAPSQDSITAACVAAVDTLAARDDIDAGRLVYYGRSLGGGAVCALARRREPAALVLQSTFTSVRAMAASLFVPGFLVRDPFDNRAWLEQWDGPTLVLHGELDDVVPFEHGRELAAASAGARLVPFACRHNDFPDDPRRFWRELGAFLVEAGIVPPAGARAEAPTAPR